MLFEAGYAIPAMSGYGEHWKLSPEESNALAEQGEAVVAVMPASKVAAISKVVATWAPVLGFVATVVIITQARVAETRRLNALAADKKGAAPVEPEGVRETPSGNGAGGSGATGAVKGPRAELFRTGE
jgi:hypothetical protein